MGKGKLEGPGTLRTGSVAMTPCFTKRHNESCNTSRIPGDGCSPSVCRVESESLQTLSVLLSFRTSARHGEPATLMTGQLAGLPAP